MSTTKRLPTTTGWRLSFIFFENDQKANVNQSNNQISADKNAIYSWMRSRGRQRKPRRKRHKQFGLRRYFAKQQQQHTNVTRLVVSEQIASTEILNGRHMDGLISRS